MLIRRLAVQIVFRSNIKSCEWLLFLLATNLFPISQGAPAVSQGLIDTQTNHSDRSLLTREVGCEAP